MVLILPPGGREGEGTGKAEWNLPCKRAKLQEGEDDYFRNDVGEPGQEPTRQGL